MVAVNKVTDMDTKRDYYPDVFIKESIPFANLCCYSRPVAQNMVQEEKEVFVIWNRLALWKLPKVLLCPSGNTLKIVSDYLNPEKLDKLSLKNFVKKVRR